MWRILHPWWDLRRKEEEELRTSSRTKNPRDFNVYCTVDSFFPLISWIDSQEDAQEVKDAGRFSGSFLHAFIYEVLWTKNRNPSLQIDDDESTVLQEPQDNLTVFTFWCQLYCSDDNSSRKERPSSSGTNSCSSKFVEGGVFTYHDWPDLTSVQSHEVREESHRNYF